jgi:hypothetical protein
MPPNLEPHSKTKYPYPNRDRSLHSYAFKLYIYTSAAAVLRAAFSRLSGLGDGMSNQQ